MWFYAVNLQVSMGVGLNMLALKETNTSQAIYGGKHDLGTKSSKVENSTNMSLQIENSTSQHCGSLPTENSTSQHYGRLPTGNSTCQHYGLARGIKVPENVSVEIGNSTTQHYNWGLSTEGSKNVSLQVENSTPPLASSSQQSEKPSNNFLVCLFSL